MSDRIQPGRVSTSWGRIEWLVAEGGIVQLRLPRLDQTPKAPMSILESADDPFSGFVCGILSGRTPERPPLGALEGTPFQRRIWQALDGIPRGETVSYGELATRLGMPRSFRALANACGRNPVPLFLPCHRVTGREGRPGGFSAGLAWKRLLLDLERAAGY